MEDKSEGNLLLIGICILTLSLGVQSTESSRDTLRRQRAVLNSVEPFVSFRVLGLGKQQFYVLIQRPLSFLSQISHVVCSYLC
jgi:hypothetical protein